MDTGAIIPDLKTKLYFTYFMVSKKMQLCICEGVSAQPKSFMMIFALLNRLLDFFYSN